MGRLTMEAISQRFRNRHLLQIDPEDRLKSKDMSREVGFSLRLFWSSCMALPSFKLPVMELILLYLQDLIQVNELSLFN